VFEGCEKLVGGSGFTYSSDCVGIDYANPGEHGYFTILPYAKFSQGTLSFHYDTHKYNDSGNLYSYVMDIKPFYQMVRPGWNDRLTEITKVVFDESMANCHTITSTAYWLAGMTNLTTIEGLEYLNTENVTSMEYMFADCQNITSLDLRGFNTENVISMENMFYGCSSLTSLDLSSFRTENARIMYYMFYGCSSLTNLDLSSFRTENVRIMSYMFYGCSSLTNLDLSLFRTRQVENMEYMFYGCSSLTTLDISFFDTGTIIYPTRCEHVFSGCSKLRTIYYNSLRFGYFSDIYSNYPVIMFEGCEQLVGGKGFAYSPDCVNNTYANSGEQGYFTVLPFAKYISYKGTFTFYYDSKYFTGELGHISNATWDLRPFDSMESRGWNDGRLQYMTKVVFHESMANCHTITSTAYWLAGMTNLTTIEGLEYLNTENVTDMKGMFADCQSIKSLDLRGFNTEKVNDMERMFYHCNGLETIFCNDVWTPQNSSDMFIGCTNLVGGNGFTYSNECTTAEYANPGEQGYFTKDKPYALLSDDNKTLTFYYGIKPADGMDVGPFTSASRRAWHENGMLITKVEFDKSMENCTSITSTAYWFSGLLNLTDIEGLEYLNTENVTDMKYMFNDCEKLTSIELNGFKTAKVTDMSRMFYNCQELTSLDVSGFKTAEVTDMNKMFYLCRKLTSLDVSGFNTAKVTNMSNMFCSCGVTTIYCDDDWYNPDIFSDYMFDGCWNLVGGSGFDFDEDCVSGEYAKPGDQGYFTRKSYMKGDVNGDGKVTPADAIMILYHYFNVNQNGFKIQAADLNGDGNITPADAIETLYKYFGNGNQNARATRPTTSDSRNPE
jgi:surface protein